MNKYIPERNATQVATGDVSSLYSPAAYLTELWQQAKTLHSDDHPHSLNVRRPDIGNLLLNQENMDAVVSTLDLSNALLANTLLKDIRARYVVIRRTPHNTVNDHMGFTELEVFSGGVNVARDKPVFSKSNAWFSGQSSANLVNGNKYEVPAASSVPVTGDFWYLVDLGKEYPIENMTLYGRKITPAALNRERDMTLFALPASALPADVATDPAKMPSYATLMQTPGVYSHSWTTLNDKGQQIAQDTESTYTLTQANAQGIPVSVPIPFNVLAATDPFPILMPG